VKRAKKERGAKKIENRKNYKITTKNTTGLLCKRKERKWAQKAKSSRSAGEAK
jgi:hypothetical protein